MIKFYSLCSNMMTTPSIEHPIEYGDAFLRYLTWIYNMGISLLEEDIPQFPDDVSNAFRWPRLHPLIAPAFSFLFLGTLYIHTGKVFWSSTIAQNFELFAKARTLLVQHIFDNEDCIILVNKYSHPIDQVRFHPVDESEKLISKQNHAPLSRYQTLSWCIAASTIHYVCG